MVKQSTSTKSDVRSLRKGVIIFFLLLIIIGIVGGWLWQESQELSEQYDQIENVLS